MAKLSDAIIVVFNVPVSPTMENLAKAEKIPLIQSSIIFKLFDEFCATVEDRLPRIETFKADARAQVKNVFMINFKKERLPIAGCRVVDGTILKRNRCRLVRDGTVLTTGTLESMKRFKEDVSECKQGSDCGLRIAGWNDYQPDDVIESLVPVLTKVNVRKPQP